jgi:hypothetical protein
VQQAMISTATVLVLVIIALFIRRRKWRRTELRELFEEVGFDLTALSEVSGLFTCPGCRVYLPSKKKKKKPQTYLCSNSQRMCVCVCVWVCVCVCVWVWVGVCWQACVNQA